MKVVMKEIITFLFKRQCDSFIKSREQQKTDQPDLIPKIATKEEDTPV